VSGSFSIRTPTGDDRSKAAVRALSRAVAGKGNRGRSNANRTPAMFCHCERPVGAFLALSLDMIETSGVY
jgi:hypothetical protein